MDNLFYESGILLCNYKRKGMRNVKIEITDSNKTLNGSLESEGFLADKFKIIQDGRELGYLSSRGFSGKFKDKPFTAGKLTYGNGVISKPLLFDGKNIATYSTVEGSKDIVINIIDGVMQDLIYFVSLRLADFSDEMVEATDLPEVDDSGFKEVTIAYEASNKVAITGYSGEPIPMSEAQSFPFKHVAVVLTTIGLIVGFFLTGIILGIDRFSDIFILLILTFIILSIIPTTTTIIIGKTQLSPETIKIITKRKKNWLIKARNAAGSVSFDNHRWNIKYTLWRFTIGILELHDQKYHILPAVQNIQGHPRVVHEARILNKQNVTILRIKGIDFIDHKKGIFFEKFEIKYGSPFTDVDAAAIGIIASKTIFEYEDPPATPAPSGG